jgi:hypothetical protein
LRGSILGHLLQGSHLLYAADVITVADWHQKNAAWQQLRTVACCASIALTMASISCSRAVWLLSDSDAAAAVACAAAALMRCSHPSWSWSTPEHSKTASH